MSAGSTDELWIGLNDRVTEGLFDWSDHSPVTFTSWEYGKPAVSSDAEDCVLIKGEVRMCTDFPAHISPFYACVRTYYIYWINQKKSMSDRCLNLREIILKINK